MKHRRLYAQLNRKPTPAQELLTSALLGIALGIAVVLTIALVVLPFADNIDKIFSR